MDMKELYSTAQVAKEIGVSKKTLLRWLWGGKIPETKMRMGNTESRVWTAAELETARAYRQERQRKRS